MEPIKLKQRKGPEAKIQADLVAYLRYREWFVKETHGSIYQSGLPDIYADHYTYGARWIEVKNPVKYEFTKAQMRDFPKFNAGIWILTAATDEEYAKLFKPANWYQYLDIWRRS